MAKAIRVTSRLSRRYGVIIDPSSIGGLQLWLKGDAGVFSDAGTTPAVNNDAIQQWNDQSGNGENFSQASATNRPLLKTGQVNGKSVVKFDGVNDYIDNVFASSISQPDTIFIVFNHIAVGGYLMDSAGAANRQMFLQPTASTIGLSADGGGTFLTMPITIPSGFVLASIVVDGASSLIRKNGTQTNAYSPGTFSISSLRIGSNSAGGDPCNAEVAELLVYSGRVTDSDIAKIENYLNSRYNIY